MMRCKYLKKPCWKTEKMEIVLSMKVSWFYFNIYVRADITQEYYKNVGC